MTPLVVDLDGTLLKTDLLVECFLGSLSRGLRHLCKAFRLALTDRAELKAYLASCHAPDYSKLPYNTAVLDAIHAAKARGQKVFLATASYRQLADGVALHLGCFDGVFATENGVNLKAAAKAALLAKTFPDGFNYIGNARADLPVWERSKKAFIVGNAKDLEKEVEALQVPFETIPLEKTTWRVWAKALRVHQYAKNALVFVPLLTSHSYSFFALSSASLAFIAFSLCASAVYLLNDLIDLEADRQHPTKSKRPFAAGKLSLFQGTVATLALWLSSFTFAFWVSPLFACVLAGYLLLTMAYSLFLKRKLLVDVIVLALLYTLRIVAGAVAIDVYISEWLLAFSLFIFTGLALAKRHIDLSLRIRDNLPDPTNRNYKAEDLPILGSLAAASGFNAITVFALYISSPAVAKLYSRPQLLWLICPLLLYWLGRLLVLVQRRIVQDDPVAFALRDRISFLVVGCMSLIVLLAT